jgi:alpha-D-xyloside xylohydrolase
MKFVPYLYGAFRSYMETGMPPIRALVLDFPNDENARTIDNQFIFGPSILVAPFLFEHKGEREVYLPSGCNWYDFATGQFYRGGQTVIVKATLDREGIENIPLFVKANSLIPLADPVPFINTDTRFKIQIRAYGPNPSPFELIEDDGISYDFEKGQQTKVQLRLVDGKISVSREGGFKQDRYDVDPKPVLFLETSPIANQNSSIQKADARNQN